MAALTNLLLVLTFGLTVATEVDLQKRVIGGRNCPNNDRAYHVRFEHPGGSLICGGSLISDRWILTAAHCLQWGMRPVLRPHSRQRQLVWMGPINLFRNVDLMLVKLEQPTNVPNISLPDCTQKTLQRGDVVQIAGYGSDQVYPNKTIVKTTASVLQCANFTVRNSGNLPDFHRTHWTKCFEVDTTSVDLSPGDSGGGVVFNNVIYGVVKGGNGIYAHVQPAYFVDICEPAYMHWITTITGITP